MVDSSHFHDASLLARRATYASVSVAGILILAKLFAWLWTDSLSLQATFVDSLLDAAASLLNLVAVRQAYRPPDKEHRFGHGKIEAVAALGQSLFISGSSAWLMLEASHRFLHPQKVESTGVGIIVMIFAILLTLLLITYQSYVIRKTRSPAILADSIHYRSDVLINGSVIIALMAGEWLNTAYLDPLFGLGISLYILWTAWNISKDSFHILIDRELPDESREKIFKIALGHPKILGCHDLKTRSSGRHSFIQLHIEMDGDISLREAHIISEQVIEALEKEFPQSEVILHEDPKTEGKTL